MLGHATPASMGWEEHVPNQPMRHEDSFVPLVPHFC